MSGYARILNKNEMYTRLAAGEFGNTMPIFRTLQEALDSKIPYLGVRSLNVGDPIRLYWVKRDELETELRKANALFRNDLIFSGTDYGTEMDRVIQGELCFHGGSLYFYHSFDHAPMRTALERSGRTAKHLYARLLLHHFVERRSEAAYLWLFELLERYEEAVIEFTMFRRPVGTEPNKLLIWEVRNY